MGFVASENFTCYLCNGLIPQGSENYAWVRKGDNMGKKYHLSCSDESFTENLNTEKGVTTMQGQSQVSNKIMEGIKELLDNAITDSVSEDRVREIVREVVQEHTELKQTVTLKVVRENGTTVTLPIVHKQFKKLLELVNLRDTKVSNVYMFGPPSSGKSTAPEQIAELLELPYYFISLNRQSVPSKLEGYMDANGKYVETTFYRWYKFGGVFQLDEKDNTSGNLLTTLNSALDNGGFYFPNGEYVKRHADAILLASGNTNGNGGNRMFPDRCLMDKAEKNRYTFVDWQFDEQMEMAIAEKLAVQYEQEKGLGTIVAEWVSKVRKYCKTYHEDFLVSQRTTYRIVILASRNLWSIQEILDMTLFVGELDELTKKEILNNCPLPQVLADLKGE